MADAYVRGANLAARTDFNAFADAMSTSYNLPIELFSVDPFSGAQTELADTSATNLLAELPVLQTQANGVNLGLQLADGKQLSFTTTAKLADFLYALAVQQLQATQFVTDNFNLDIQWLNTVDQPLLNEAVNWSEQATTLVAQAAAAAAKAGGYAGAIEAGPDQQAAEANTEASLALKIAAEAPSSRQDMSVTIANPVAGNPTQITVYANGSGGAIHDTTPGILGYVESAISTLVDIAAVVTGQAYLYFAAAAIDGAEAGQAFSNGQDVQGLLSLAEAVAAGINGGGGGTTPAGTTPTVPLTTAQVTALAINVAAEGVGGVYGAVTSAENGNAAGILAGALEAAAAAAAGIGMLPGTQTQTLNKISAALGLASVATNMGSDFANGNLAQGLIDSLNLYLPAEALASSTDQANQSNLVMNSAAFAEADANAIPNPTLPAFASVINEFITSPSSIPQSGNSRPSETNPTVPINTNTLQISAVPAFLTGAGSPLTIIPAAYNGTYHDQVVNDLAQDLRNLGATIETEVALQGFSPNPFTGLPAPARIDMIAQGPGTGGITIGIEVKTGDDPGYTIGQRVTYPQVIAGHAFSMDPKITSFGFQVGQPLPAIPIIQYYDPGPGYPPDLKTLIP